MDLWCSSSWTLPPARSENQVIVQTFLSTIQISDQEDSMEWFPNNIKSTRFFIGEVYDILRDQNPDVTRVKEIWFSPGIPHHMFFSWLITLNRRPTKDRMIRWGLQTDPLCVLCRNGSESRLHLFFQCGFALSIWEPLARKRNFNSPRDWDDILHATRVASGSKPFSKLLRLSYQAASYLVWKERNSRIHRQVFRSTVSVFIETNRIFQSTKAFHFQSQINNFDCSS